MIQQLVRRMSRAVVLPVSPRSGASMLVKIQAIKSITLLIGLSAVLPLLSFCQPMALHDGDRVLFYGDSITAQRLYTRFVEDFLLTRYPELQVSFFNAGVPGDTVYGGYTG